MLEALLGSLDLRHDALRKINDRRLAGQIALGSAAGRAEGKFGAEFLHRLKEPFRHFAYRRRDQLPDLRHSLSKRSAAELRGSGDGIHRVCHVGAEGGGGRLECASDVSSVTFNVLAQGPQAVVNRLAESFQSPPNVFSVLDRGPGADLG